MKYLKWIILLIVLFGGVIIIYNTQSSENSNAKDETTVDEDEEKQEEENSLSMKVIIDDVEYSVTLEDNETVKKLIDMLPMTIEMSELNGNEKYYYLDNTLPTNNYFPDTIEKGDIMLYSSNCLVLFYDTFNTSYSYTKIGHIDNLPDLDDGNIIVTLERLDENE